MFERLLWATIDYDSFNKKFPEDLVCDIVIILYFVLQMLGIILAQDWMILPADPQRSMWCQELRAPACPACAPAHWAISLP